MTAYRRPELDARPKKLIERTVASVVEAVRRAGQPPEITIVG